MEARAREENTRWAGFGASFASPDRMSLGTATPVITGCGAGQALKQLFIHFNRHLPIYAVLTVCKVLY